MVAAASVRITVTPPEDSVDGFAYLDLVMKAMG